MRLKSAIAALLVAAAGATAGPWHMTYCVRPENGAFRYTFTLTLVNDDNTWVAGSGIGWIIFGDKEGAGGPDPTYSEINDFVMDPASYPIGPFTELTSSGGGHNGPTLGPIIRADPDHPDPNDPLHWIWINWVPTAVGQSITWSGTSATEIAEGEVLWSNLLTQNNAGPYTYFEVATLDCGGGGCYANCDESSVDPILNANDFQCFLNAYAAATSLTEAEQIAHYANCDHSSVAPVLNANDFQCFLNAYAVGCT